jgi:hypothetical protein
MTVENIERDQYRRSPRGCLMTMVIIVLGTFVCLGIIVFTTNTVCQQNAQLWIPPYPNSQVVAENKTFLTAFGVGITQVTLSSPDEPDVVREWYLQTRRSNDANPTNLLATMNYRINDGENGGSSISLYSECAWR